MAQRSEKARDEHHKWDIGAGAVEIGQSLDEALRREIMEEYCTDVLDKTFLGYREVMRNHEYGPTHWISFDFAVLIDPDKVANGEPDKLSDIGWFTKDNMPEQVHSQWPHFLEIYKDKLPF